MENVPGLASMTMPDGSIVIDELCRILERGDFGEFEAMRQVLTGHPDRKVLKCGAGAPKRQSLKKPGKPAETSAQASLFGEPPQSSSS